VSETLLLGIRCEWAGDKSFAFRYEIREKMSDRLVVEATTVQVCYDYVRKQSISMPQDLRLAVEMFEGRELAPKPMAPS
jgi:acyl-CoA thioesterase FadM